MVDKLLKRCSYASTVMHGLTPRIEDEQMPCARYEFTLLIKCESNFKEVKITDRMSRNYVLLIQKNLTPAICRGEIISFNKVFYLHLIYIRAVDQLLREPYQPR